MIVERNSGAQDHLGMQSNSSFHSKNGNVNHNTTLGPERTAASILYKSRSFVNYNTSLNGNGLPPMKQGYSESMQ